MFIDCYCVQRSLWIIFEDLTGDTEGRFQVVESLRRQIAVGHGRKRLFDPGLKLVELVLRLDGEGHRSGAVVAVLERDQRLVNLVIFELK